MCDLFQQFGGNDPNVKNSPQWQQASHYLQQGIDFLDGLRKQFIKYECEITGIPSDMDEKLRNKSGHALLFTKIQGEGLTIPIFKSLSIKSILFGGFSAKTHTLRFHMYSYEILGTIQKFGNNFYLKLIKEFNNIIQDKTITGLKGSKLRIRRIIRNRTQWVLKGYNPNKTPQQQLLEALRQAKEIK